MLSKIYISQIHNFSLLYIWFQNFIFAYNLFLLTWRVRKNFLYFSKMKLFQFIFKNSGLFLENSYDLSFLHVFVSFCFSFFMFSFLDIFVSLDVFIIGCICDVTASVTDLRERFFLPGVFYLTLPSCFYQGFLCAGSSALKVEGLSTRVRSTDPAHVFV